MRFLRRRTVWERALFVVLATVALYCGSMPGAWR